MKTITNKIRQHLLYRKCKQCGGKVVIDERRTNYEAFLGIYYYSCEDCQQYYVLSQIKLSICFFLFLLAISSIIAIQAIFIKSELLFDSLGYIEICVFLYLLLKVMHDKLLKPTEKPQTIYDNKPQHQEDSIVKSVKNLTIKEKIILSLFTLLVIAMLIYLIKYLR